MSKSKEHDWLHTAMQYFRDEQIYSRGLFWTEDFYKGRISGLRTAESILGLLAWERGIDLRERKTINTKKVKR